MPSKLAFDILGKAVAAKLLNGICCNSVNFNGILNKATAALPNGLILIMIRSAFLNKLVPIKVNVLYFPKFNKVAFVVLLAFLIQIKPSQPLTMVFKDVNRFTISKTQTSCKTERLKKMAFNTKTKKEEASSTGDFEDVDLEEQTGFLEDERMGTLNTMIDQQIHANNNNNIHTVPSSGGGDFMTVRFNPDDHIPTIVEDGEVEDSNCGESECERPDQQQALNSEKKETN